MLRKCLDEDGFYVLHQAVSSAKTLRLQAVAEAVEKRARTGIWPHVRTVGKQFPPWNASDAAEHGIWGIQHLMNPKCPFNEEYTEMYFSDVLLDPAKALMGCEDDELVMELFNMLVQPEKDFELKWHRDDIPPEATAEEELERLNRPSWHVQYNLALYHDSSLIVVPGSHKRARTDIERAAGPYDKLPDQEEVVLSPGAIVFYNNNILHRGVYDPNVERVTLHGSVGHVKGSNLRARNVLQHGVGEWAQNINLSKLDPALAARAEGMRDRLVKMGTESGDVGFSLQG
ncbi:hypothetical protein CC79DRAFT_1342522 [Sarocladium strictum]